MVTREQSGNDSQSEDKTTNGEPDTFKKWVSQVVPFG
jgi:hypothetical protein